MRIVVADQDTSFSESFQSFLRARGHEAEIVSDGLACLSALRDLDADALAISNNLLWGGSEGVLSVMYDDHQLRDLPVLLLQHDGLDLRLRRHPMVASASCGPFQFEDLTNQLRFLSILSEDEACTGGIKEAQSVANAIPCMENAMWNA